MATPAVVRMRGVRRQDGVGVPKLTSPAEWIDSRSVAIGVAETYTLPVDAAGNRATILRIFCNSVNLYIKWDGTAAVPAADILDGTASTSVVANLARRYLIAPNSAYALSLVCGNNAIITIEAWS